MFHVSYKVSIASRLQSYSSSIDSRGSWTAADSAGDLQWQMLLQQTSEVCLVTHLSLDPFHSESFSRSATADLNWSYKCRSEIVDCHVLLESLWIYNSLPYLLRAQSPEMLRSSVKYKPCLSTCLPHGIVFYSVSALRTKDSNILQQPLYQKVCKGN